MECRRPAPRTEEIKGSDNRTRSNAGCFVDFGNISHSSEKTFCSCYCYSYNINSNINIKL